MCITYFYTCLYCGAEQGEFNVYCNEWKRHTYRRQAWQWDGEGTTDRTPLGRTAAREIDLGHPIEACLSCDAQPGESAPFHS